MAHGLPGSPSRRRANYSFLCGTCARWGGRAGGKGRRSRVRPAAGPLQPPRRKPPKLRGKSSYQAPTAARGRSTQTGHRRARAVKSVAERGPARAWATDADKATLMRLASSSSGCSAASALAPWSPPSLVTEAPSSHVERAPAPGPRGDRGLRQEGQASAISVPTSSRAASLIAAL